MIDWLRDMQALVPEELVRTPEDETHTWWDLLKPQVCEWIPPATYDNQPEAVRGPAMTMHEWYSRNGVLKITGSNPGRY